MNTKPAFFILLLLHSLYCATAFSRPDDRDQPIHITADTAELNDKTGISIYRGDVEMVQGTTILTGDVITIHSPDRKVNKVISIGDLATYQETTVNGDIIYAEAEEMLYNRVESKIELFRRGKVTQQDNVFRSEHIIYFIEEELIDAGTPKDRVNITILPDSDIFDKERKKKIKNIPSSDTIDKEAIENIKSGVDLETVDKKELEKLKNDSK